MDAAYPSRTWRSRPPDTQRANSRVSKISLDYKLLVFVERLWLPWAWLVDLPSPLEHQRVELPILKRIGMVCPLPNILDLVRGQLEQPLWCKIYSTTYRIAWKPIQSVRAMNTPKSWRFYNVMQSITPMLASFANEHDRELIKQFWSTSIRPNWNM